MYHLDPSYLKAHFSFLFSTLLQAEFSVPLVPSPRLFHTKILSSYIVFLHTAAKTCHSSSGFSATHHCSTSCLRSFQFIALNSVFCPSSCPHCQPWHSPPQGGNTCSNTHALVVIERFSTKKYRHLTEIPCFLVCTAGRHASLKPAYKIFCLGNNEVTQHQHKAEPSLKSCSASDLLLYRTFSWLFHNTNGTKS